MYNILTTSWLEDLAQQPSSTAFRLLNPHYKEEYTNERFVFYNAQPVDQTHLNHLLFVLDYIDISRFFCLVITNQQEVYDFFIRAGCSAELDTSVKTSPGVLDPVQPLYYNPTMCPHAWAGLHLNPNGDTIPCCEYQGGVIPDGNIKDHNFDDILLSDYMSALRQQFRNGVTPTGCRSCEQREQLGLSSRRLLSTKKLGTIFGYINWEQEPSASTPKYFGGHIGNLCNLKCRICTPEYSSQIAAEEIKYANKTLINHNWNKGHNNFWDFLKHNNEIVSYEILGGEPLLLPKNIELIDHLVSSGQAANCQFEVVTNGTQYPDILDKATEFDRFKVTVSVDNIGKRFEYERKNAKWNQVTANIKKMIAANIDLSISLTVSALNVYYLPETVDWIEQQNLDYYINVVEHPNEISVKSLPLTVRNKVIERLEPNPTFNSLVEYINDLGAADNSQLINYIRNKDLQRGENLKDSHPELAELLGYML